MNGVRRFLGNATSPPTSIPASKDRTSISSRSSSSIKEFPPPPLPTTKGLFIRRDRKPAPPLSGPSSTASSPTTSTPPPRRKAPPPELEETFPPSPSQASGLKPANTRDALLLSLLSSEAMVDSRGYEILSAEEVEELKKEHTVLSSRVGALQKKLATEVKIRDAAQTLARLNASSASPTRISRDSNTALETAERKAEVAQTELWRVQERATNIGRRLLEHRAGVLGAALEETESAQAQRRVSALDVNDLPSPLSSPAHKFDGAHLFAGHEDAVVPGAHSPDAAPQGSSSASQKGLEELEARLAAAEEHGREQHTELENVRTAAAAELEDVRAAAEEELADVRAANASELARAQECTGGLERRVAELERELESSIRGGEDAVDLEARVRTLERKLSDAERKAERAQMEAENAAAAWDAEKASWASERALFGQEKERWVELSATLESERELWELEREDLTAQAKDQIVDAANGLRGLIQRFDIPLFSRESGLGVLVDAVERYLEKHNARESGQLLAAEAEKCNAMTRELEAAKAEIQALQVPSSGSPSSSIHMEPRPSSPISFARDAAGFVAILQPLWATLPSPEARVSRLSHAARPFRAGSGRTSPNLRGPGSPSVNAVSISDMDVRALKTLYTPGVSGSSAGGSADPASPATTVGGTGVFSVEAFAQRVQALISDDRALMERLIRFAQAHDLLKKNAERAQKLAQESNAALETYQRQVRTLEEHLANSDGWEEQVERMSAEKVAVELRGAEQAETLRELTSANAALSARAQQLARDAVAAQEELRAVSSVSEREQAQRLALLEEINLVQTENGNLRQQLRTLGKL